MILSSDARSKQQGRVNSAKKGRPALPKDLPSSWPAAGPGRRLTGGSGHSCHSSSTCRCVPGKDGGGKTQERTVSYCKGRGVTTQLATVSGKRQTGVRLHGSRNTCDMFALFSFPTQKHQTKYIFSLRIKSPRGSCPKGFVIGPWRHVEMQYCLMIKTTGTAVRRNKVLVHPTTWMDLEGIMMSERANPQKVTHWMIPLV